MCSCEKGGDCFDFNLGNEVYPFEVTTIYKGLGIVLVDKKDLIDILELSKHYLFYGLDHLGGDKLVERIDGLLNKMEKS